MLNKERDDTDEGGAHVDHRQVDVFLVPVSAIRRWKILQPQVSPVARVGERDQSVKAGGGYVKHVEASACLRIKLN